MQSMQCYEDLSHRQKTVPVCHALYSNASHLNVTPNEVAASSRVKRSISSPLWRQKCQ